MIECGRCHSKSGNISEVTPDCVFNNFKYICDLCHDECNSYLCEININEKEWLNKQPLWIQRHGID